MRSIATFKLAPLLMCGLWVAGAAGSAHAQSSTPAQALLDDQWVLNLGTFIVRSDIKASLNGHFADNPQIDFDQAFGRGNDATRVRADALWRITPTHHLRFMYFNNTVNRSRAIDETIKWGDYTFDVGGNVDFRHKVETVQLAYEYAFVRQPTYDVSASLGVHVSRNAMQLSGAATVTDGETTTHVSAATQSNSFTAPLPVIGLRAGWVVSPSWFIDAGGQYFKIKYDGYDGYWSDLRLGATWMYNQNFGIGLGYNRFATNVTVNRDSFSGRLKTGYSGLQVYLTGAF